MNDNWDNLRRIADKMGDSLDVDKAWAKFDHRRKKRKRRVLFWLWGVGVFGILIVGWNSFEHYKSSDKSEVENVAHDQSLSMKISPNEKKNTHSEKVNEVVFKNENDTEEKVTSNLNNQIHIQNDVAGSSNVSSNLTDLRNAASVLIDDNSKQEVANFENYSAPENEIDDSFNLGNDFLETTQESRASANYKNPALGFTDNTAPVVETIDALPITIQDLLFSRSYETEVPEWCPLEEINRNNTDRQRWSYGLTYELSKPYRTLYSDDLLFAERRALGEQFLEGNFLKFKIERTSGNKFYFGSGIEIGHYRSRINEIVQDLILEIEYDNQIVAVVSKNGQTTNVLGTVIGSQTIISENVRYQRYVDIRIPFYAGISIPINNRSMLKIDGGLSSTIWTRQLGNTYESYFSTGVYESLDKLTFKRFGQIQSNMSIEYLKQIDDNISITIGLNGRLDINSRNAQGSIFSDKFRSLGLTFGISKKW